MPFNSPTRSTRTDRLSNRAVDSLANDAGVVDSNGVSDQATRRSKPKPKTKPGAQSKSGVQSKPGANSDSTSPNRNKIDSKTRLPANSPKAPQAHSAKLKAPVIRKVKPAGTMTLAERSIRFFYAGLFQSKAWAVSFSLHLGLLIILSIVSIGYTNSGGDTIFVSASTEQAEPLELSTFRAQTKVSESSSASSKSATQGKPKEVELKSGDLPAFWNPDAQPMPMDDLLGYDTDILNQELPWMGQEGQSNSKQGTRKSGSQFFGIESGGQKFVFVIDCSNSMRGAKWRRACKELLAAIESFSEDHEYYVIFFDNQPHMMFSQKLDKVAMANGGKESFKKLRRWISSVRLGSWTRPYTSLQVAMKLEPDAIYLLSDGEIQDQTLVNLRLSNRVDNEELTVKTSIHTIAFESVEGGEVMKQLAEENRGQFRFIK